MKPRLRAEELTGMISLLRDKLVRSENLRRCCFVPMIACVLPEAGYMLLINSSSVFKNVKYKKNVLKFTFLRQLRPQKTTTSYNLRPRVLNHYNNPLPADKCLMEEFYLQTYL